MRYFNSVVVLTVSATIVSFLLSSLFPIMVIEKLFSFICLVGFRLELVADIYSGNNVHRCFLVALVL